jgi:hypothetical protein
MSNDREFQVLHLGRTVQQWRTIAGCVRNSAKLHDGTERNRLNQIAKDIESQLPLLPSAKEPL